MPPVIPRRTRRPARVVGPSIRGVRSFIGAPCPLARGELPPRSPPLLRGLSGLGALEGDLILADFLEGDGQGLLPQSRALHERRDELGAALPELAVVGVDLPGPLGGQDHQRVLGVNPLQKVVDAGVDHVCSFESWLLPASIISRTRATAASSSSFMTMWSNQVAWASSLRASASRRSRAAPSSVPRSRSRRASSSSEGGARKMRTAWGRRFRICAAPWTSISFRTSRPSARAPLTSLRDVPERCPKTLAHPRSPPASIIRSNSASG